MMKKLFVAILTAGLMTGCSSEPTKPATAEKPQPKAPEIITGSSAFFKCYVSARGWAPAAQPHRVDSHPEAGSKGRHGKAAAWRAAGAAAAPRPRPALPSARGDLHLPPRVPHQRDL